MKRFTTILAAAILFVGAAVFASDAWKEKPFESWDEKDVQKIMNDSPWVRKVQFGTPSGGGAGCTVTNSGDAAHGGQTLGSAGSDGGCDASRANRGSRGGASGDPSLSRESTFVARWVSARVMRQAQARQAVLNGKSLEEATKSLAAQPEAYQIVLIGSDLRSFARTDEAALKQSTYLELKKTHEKLTPTRVQIMKAGNGNGMPAAVLFEFARKSASGEPAIGSDEKNADFVTMAGTNKLKFGFDFSKMADKQGADI